MERLWSPWRMEYIAAARGEVGGCIFCDLPARSEDGTAFILVRGDVGFVMLNTYPYNPGHLMIAPFRHVGMVEDLKEDEILETGQLLQRSVAALRAEMDPQGFNVGMNLGRVAGAGVPDHVHFHVVPRWSGDTNFMPVVAGTRVLPELLEDTYRKLRPRFAHHGARGA